MLLRNRALFTEAALSLMLTAVLSAAVFIWNAPFGWATLGGLAGLTAIHLTFSALRYRRLQKLSLEVDRLLHEGGNLEIRGYQEGELSILANQIQKMTIRLTESVNAATVEKNRLADSLADISHQLRTPLTAMNLTAAMLSAEELPFQRRQELTRELKKQLSRTDWLVNTLLKLSKLDAETVELARERVPVRLVAARAAEPLAIPMELRDQQLILDCGDAAFTGDMVWTVEAVGNILKNAVEHTPDGGAICLRAWETPLFTGIEIENEGEGFAPEDIPHLFERFYKGKNASQDSFGIGLALARTVIAAQNGTIQASNTPSGAKFVIKLYKITV